MSAPVAYDPAAPAMSQLATLGALVLSAWQQGQAEPLHGDLLERKLLLVGIARHRDDAPGIVVPPALLALLPTLVNPQDCHP